MYQMQKFFAVRTGQGKRERGANVSSAGCLRCSLVHQGTGGTRSPSPFWALLRMNGTKSSLAPAAKGIRCWWRLSYTPKLLLWSTKPVPSPTAKGAGFASGLGKCVRGGCSPRFGWGWKGGWASSLTKWFGSNTLVHVKVRRTWNSPAFLCWQEQLNPKLAVRYSVDSPQHWISTVGLPVGNNTTFIVSELLIWWECHQGMRSHARTLINSVIPALIF